MKSNCYTCGKCHGQIVTINDDCGITPFMLACKMEGCKGKMVSSFGRIPPNAPEPSFKWYIPERIWFMSRLEKEHHSKGGAFLRRISK